jgi:ribonuclease E
MAEPGRRTAAVPQAAEESPNFFDERFDFEEPYDLLESGEAPAAGPETAEPTTEPTTESTDEPAEKRPRRRRRRRGRGRGRDSEQRDSSEKAQPEDSGDRVDEAVAEVGEESDRISVVEEVVEAEGVDIDQPRDEAAKSEERRTKRRRPRRGKKKPRSAEPDQTAADESRDAESVSDSDDSHEMETVEVGALADDRIESGEDDDDDGPSARLGFRGIPTWDEAIGMIVDKNLEARAKRPSSGSHPSRGRRGPRDNRSQGGKRRS